MYSPLYNTKEEAAYMRLLLEKFFYTGIGMNNSSKLIQLADSITTEQKTNIDEYFKSKSKKWIKKDKV